MNPILLAIIVVTVIGIIGAVILVAASILMYVPVDERVEQITGVLAGANCGACGCAGCADYAKSIVEDGAPVNKCTPGGAACAAAIAQINANLSAQLRIDELAQQCYISRSYLARQFKKEMGMTIKEYILMQLINTAQWQLSHTDAPVERISRELGFCNQFYFSECFKKHCRVSPLQYRNGTKY